jgi:type I restriction enzyme M protein
MLTPDTRHHIDAARQILVGKVPDPKSQIEQITNALIYKFMDDMDEQAAALGGKRTYFVGDYEKYGWQKLMAESLGAHERLILYREAIEGMSKNKNLPELFRSIFRNAYLPFNDARTLTLFLTEINFFSYENSEELGNGYEYLLSIMGSQGDAGQFRTPRHIIDFIVECVDPTKNDSVLDPACGTAGFLISAYKHVMAQHDGKNDITGVAEQNEIPLTADEKKKLYHSYHGFDIDDNMVKMARVNMYLHSFPDPDIKAHDSLSSEEYWNERYDVILANPPFMTPKGGIVPHKKFGIQANRAEVLFIDYIASHLKPTGRAGIIVPEGIIFQSGKAYKELRKNLVENYLYAVVSLPAGVFQPYSGVKTSILLLDKELAKQRDEILFVKIENDGLSSGAQRRPIAGNQFPEATELIKKFQTGEPINSDLAHAVPCKQIAETTDYNLSGDRYKTTQVHEHGEWPMVELSEVVQLIGGGTPSRTNPKYWGGGIEWITSKYFSDYHSILGYENITEEGLRNSSTNIAPAGSTILITRVSVGKYAYADRDYALNQDLTALIVNDERVLDGQYLFHIASMLADNIKKNAVGIGVTGVTRQFVAKMKIPLPPIEVQRKIVAEIENKQVAIDHAREIIKVLERERDSILTQALAPKKKAGQS